MALGQAIMDARERRRITREELAEELLAGATRLGGIGDVDFIVFSNLAKL